MTRHAGRPSAHAVRLALIPNIGSYLGRHFDDVRNHSSSSRVGGTHIVGLPDSSTSTPVSPFSGSTKWILNEIERSLLASAARASSRSKRRDTPRINLALVRARGCAQGASCGKSAAFRRWKDDCCLGKGTPFPAPNLRRAARLLPNGVAVDPESDRPHAVTRDQPEAQNALRANVTV